MTTGRLTIPGGRPGNHPPFWGLSLGLKPGAHVLVLEDRPDERSAILHHLLADADVTWAQMPEQVEIALKEHGPFDVYCLDYDLGGERGGWFHSGELIRRIDPRSVAKLVLIHSANTDARAYYALFPAAIYIQWDVLATILGEPLVDDALIDALLKETGADASVDQMRDAVLRIRESSDEN